MAEVIQAEPVVTDDGSQAKAPVALPDSRSFFRFGQLGCLSFTALLALVLLVTLFSQAIWLLRPVNEVAGVIGPIQEERRGQTADYGLAVRPEQGELLYLRLRNNGRVMAYLQASGYEGPARIRYRGNKIASLEPLAGGRPAVGENGSPLASLGLALFAGAGLLLLPLLARPDLLERRLKGEGQ
jgi:hypothetical protein